MKKTLSLIFVLFVLTVVGAAVLMTSQPKMRKNADLLYAMDMTKINAANGAVISHGAIVLETEAQLKTDAENESSSTVTVLIGTSSHQNGPVDNIQLVGVGGVAFGNIVPDCPEEEK